MTSQFDRIWCLEYDQDSYHRQMSKIPFSKYLNQNLSNQYYPPYQEQLNLQLQNEHEWNERSWAILQLFQYFDHVFDIQEFEANVKFIADKQVRRTFGNFRMWIDVERLYLLAFLKMDQMEFQEDRIFFSLYRAMCFLNELLSDYQVGDFKREFLNRIHTQLIMHANNLQKCLPVYMHEMIKAIRQIIPNFINKYALIDFKQKDQAKKLAFRKLSRQYDMMPEISLRLHNNIQFQTKLSQLRELSYFGQSPEILSLTAPIQSIYDPKIRILSQYKQSPLSQSQSKPLTLSPKPSPSDPLSEQKVNELLKNYYSKSKQKPATQNPYLSLMRTGHNPYDESNYTIFGEGLGIDIKEKQQLEREVQREVEEEVEERNELVGNEGYIGKGWAMGVEDVSVTKRDLNQRAVQIVKKPGQDNSTLLRNLKWDQSGYQEDQEGKKNAATTVRSINLKKNLQNNALFMKHEQQQKQKNILALTKILRKGYNSNTLYYLEKKCQHLSQPVSPSSTRTLFSISCKTTMDRSKFDTLRKVAQYHAVNRKINKWSTMHKVPKMYPRGIDQIRRHYVDLDIEEDRRAAMMDGITDWD